MIYVFALLISIYFALLTTYTINRKKVFNQISKSFFVYLSLAPLVVLYAFRADVGIDHYSYLEIFDRVKYSELRELTNLSQEIEKESFFLFINFIGNKLGLGLNFVYFSCSVITFYFFYKALTYYDINRKYLIVSIIIFYSQVFFSGLDAVRQIVAVSIYFYSTKFIYERKLFKFIIWLFVGSAFHTSALLLIPTYFILNKKIKPLIYTLLCLLFLLLSTIFSPIVLFDLMERLFPEWKYLRDLSHDVTYGGTVGVVYFIHLITCIGITFFQKEKFNDGKKIIPIQMYLLFTMLFPIASPYLSTKRLLSYLCIGMTLGIPFGLERIKKYKLKKYILPLLVIYSLFFILLFLSSVRSGYLNPLWLHEPYKFIFLE
ncbi:EpsG family protein [Peribacillus frigoritolerans]|uniref:EpsG family protein n=1 Tax=Peribacillus frigoritolerans TaxID=450367 RepID=UPI003D269D9C